MKIILALIAFGFIIFIHELGHFYFAKRAGVTIHEFSIGMGPKLLEKTKNGTQYSLRLLPIGGYVAMEGEDEESNDPNSFGKKTIGQRLLSIVAGPVANILLCILLLIPVHMLLGTPTTRFDQVLPNSAAQEAGLKKGDTILSINGEKIDTYDKISQITASNGTKEMKISYKRDGKINSTSLTPKKVQGKYMIGIKPAVEKSFAYAPIKAVESTYKTSKAMLEFLWKLITGQLSKNVVNSLAGPVGVVGMFSKAANDGVIYFLYLTAIISLNIGIFNLLPIPALDGWRILILLIEAIRGGKKLPAKLEGAINAFGLAALLLLMLFVTYKDILRIFTK